MLVVLSPAKSLDLTGAESALLSSVPEMMDQVNTLLPVVQRVSLAEMKKIFGVSDVIAKLNHERFRDFELAAAKQAVFTFDGPAYKHLDAASLQPDELHFCQDHLRILCGLYGVLRPLDAMKPYRLEMGTKLANPHGKDLYAFWGDAITDALNQDLRQVPASERFLVNCASQEYFKAINEAKVDGTVYHMVFPGPSVYAKQARGAMVRHICQAKVASPEDLKAFTGKDGEYAFDERQSTTNHFVFVRRATSTDKKTPTKAAKASAKAPPARKPTPTAAPKTARAGTKRKATKADTALEEAATPAAKTTRRSTQYTK